LRREQNPAPGRGDLRQKKKNATQIKKITCARRRQKAKKNAAQKIKKNPGKRTNERLKAEQKLHRETTGMGPLFRRQRDDPFHIKSDTGKTTKNIPHRPTGGRHEYNPGRVSLMAETKYKMNTGSQRKKNRKGTQAPCIQQGQRGPLLTEKWFPLAKGEWFLFVGKSLY